LSYIPQIVINYSISLYDCRTIEQMPPIMDEIMGVQNVVRNPLTKIPL